MKPTLPGTKKHPTADQVIGNVGMYRNILVGDIIPTPWLSRILDRQGRPHYLAITLLADIVWRYTRYKDSNRKFTGRYYQLNRNQIVKKLNASSKAISRALTFLESKNLIRTIPVDRVIRGAVKTEKLFMYPIAESVAKYSEKLKKTETGKPRDDGDSLDSWDENDGDSPAPLTGTGEAREQGQAGSVDGDSLASLSVTEDSNDEELTVAVGAAADVSPSAPHPDALPSASLAPSSPSQSPSSTKRLDGCPEAELGMFWTKALPLKRNVDKPLSDEERQMLKMYFAEPGHWLPLSLAVLALAAWENIGAKNKDSGYKYGYCQRSYRLEYFLEHVDDTADDCGLAKCNTWETLKRVDRMLGMLDKLTHGDKAASDKIVAECFPEDWATFMKCEKHSQSEASKATALAEGEAERARRRLRDETHIEFSQHWGNLARSAGVRLEMVLPYTFHRAWETVINENPDLTQPARKQELVELLLKRCDWEGAMQREQQRLTSDGQNAPHQALLVRSVEPTGRHAGAPPPPPRPRPLSREVKRESTTGFSRR
jgi:hypothetical protein